MRRSHARSLQEHVVAVRARTSLSRARRAVARDRTGIRRQRRADLLTGRDDVDAVASVQSRPVAAEVADGAGRRIFRFGTGFARPRIPADVASNADDVVCARRLVERRVVVAVAVVEEVVTLVERPGVVWSSRAVALQQQLELIETVVSVRALMLVDRRDETVAVCRRIEQRDLNLV